MGSERATITNRELPITATKYMIRTIPKMKGCISGQMDRPNKTNSVTSVLFLVVMRLDPHHLQRASVRIKQC